VNILDSQDKRNESEEQEATRKSGTAYAAGLTIFFSVLTFLGFGYLLDRWLGTAPWLMVAGILLGSAVGFYEFIRIMSKIK
jgi:ATP synthase protein I